MIATMPGHGEGTLGFTVSGDVTKEDYAVLTPAVEAAVAAHGTVRLLLEDNVTRMALVGNKNWERHLASLAELFYAKKVRFFENTDDAWDWIDSSDSN